MRRALRVSTMAHTADSHPLQTSKCRSFSFCILPSAFCLSKTPAISHLSPNFACLHFAKSLVWSPAFRRSLLSVPLPPRYHRQTPSQLAPIVERALSLPIQRLNISTIKRFGCGSAAPRPLRNSFLLSLGIWYLAFGHFSASFAAESGAVPKPFVPAAKPAEEKPFSEADWVDDRWTKTDIGQFLHFTVQTPRKTTPKAITIKVGENDEAAVCFDTDLLRYSAAWTGGFLKIPDVRYGLMAPCAPAGEIQFTTEPGPGWAKNDSFEDPRKQKFGPLPRDWAKYNGLYQSGRRVVLAYTVNGAPVLESPWFETIDGLPVFTRTIEIGPGRRDLALRVSDVAKGTATVSVNNSREIGLVEDATSVVGIAAIGLAGSEPFLMAVENQLEIHLAKTNTESRFKLYISKLSPGALPKFEKFAASLKTAKVTEPGLRNLTKGGPAHWPALTTTGHVDRADSPFAIDTITMPYENPWKALMFASGHDFFSNGDAAVATAHGDVWRVGGINENLRKLTWKRFATGLYQPLGLKIINDKVHVLERDQITILHDLNNDGEADYYENFNNDTISAGGSHSYSTCLETDSQGNFYFTKCSEGTPHGGTVMKVLRDGSGVEVVATGFRYPNGLGMGPGDIITAADQQGEWVPETRLNIVKPGEFYGYMPSHHRATAPTTYDPPLLWVPRALDNSAGGQVWVPPNTWGPLAGQMLHLSFGRCTMMLVLRDQSSTVPQGAVVSLPGRFASGVCRGRFNSKDGHLYLTGLSGWQTAAVRDGCFQRVRYQKPLPLPTAYAVTANNLSVTFSEPLNRELAEDTESYSAEQWNYLWSSKYGSADYSLADPEKEGRDPVKITTAKLQPDNKTVLLTVAGGLRPVMTFALTYNLETATGTPLQTTFYTTINRIP